MQNPSGVYSFFFKAHSDNLKISLVNRFRLNLNILDRIDLWIDGLVGSYTGINCAVQVSFF